MSVNVRLDLVFNLFFLLLACFLNIHGYINDNAVRLPLKKTPPHMVFVYRPC